MDVREKLADMLFSEIYSGGIICDGDTYQRVRDGFIKIADRLIANGVTVQNSKVVEIDQFNKWISVKDRLPEPFVSVLVQMPGEEPFPTVSEGFISSDGIWQSAMFRREPGEVTHWQPMPQPPKGE